MIGYLVNSDIAVRLNLNPFAWNWIPFFAYDRPTQFFVHRHTIAFGWLFLQIFFDVDDGVKNMKNFMPIFEPMEMVEDENEEELPTGFNDG